MYAYCLFTAFLNIFNKNNIFFYSSYETAYTFFQESLKRIQTSDQTVLPVKWEGLLNNLGHACRKLKLVYFSFISFSIFIYVCAFDKFI